MTNSGSDRIEQVTTYPIYDQDFYAWLEKTASLLKEKKFYELDLLNLIEEIETLGRSEKRALKSNLVVVLMHLLKYIYQPQKRTNSWLYSITQHRHRLDDILTDSPSLQHYIHEIWAKSYEEARREAAIETGLPINVFPAKSPFTPEQALDIDWLP